MKYFVTEKIGPKMSVTPEGYLLCEDVTIARTGWQLYTSEEVPVAPGPDGLVHIERRPEDVFKPESIASFNGKSFTNNHPPDGVSMEAWKELTCGIVMYPRRGEGAADDTLVADILVMNEMTIALIHSGKREVSAGYDCDYQDLGNGRGYQKDIRGNHVALVDAARCGARCTIADEDSTGEDSLMKKWLDSIKAAFATKNEAEFNALLKVAPVSFTADEAAPGGVHVHMNGGDEGGAMRSKWNDEAIEKKFNDHEKMMSDGFSKGSMDMKSVMDSLEEIKKGMAPKAEDAAEEKEIEGALKEEAPAGTGDVKEMKDSAVLVDLYRETISLAEIIAPGIHYATFDSAMKPTKTIANICALRRKALTLGNNAPDTAGMIESVNGGRALTSDSLDKMKCGSVRAMFFSVGAMKRAANNARTNDGGKRETTDAGASKMPLTPADINRRNAEFYGATK